MRPSILIILTLWLTSCQEAQFEQLISEGAYGYDYFPLEVGKYRTYRVDSIQFDLGINDLPVSDSSTFFIREQVVEKFSDQTGQEIYRIERFRSRHLDDPGQIMDVVTQSRTTNQAYLTENNIKFIPLVFPIREGQRWEGNAFIPDDMVVFVQGEALEMFRGWDYQVLSLGVAESIGGIAHQDVATIQQSDNENLIEYRFSQEKYAKGVGRIYRHRQILNSYCKELGFNEPCIGKTWREKAGKGFILRETLIDFN